MSPNTHIHTSQFQRMIWQCTKENLRHHYFTLKSHSTNDAKATVYKQQCSKCCKVRTKTHKTRSNICDDTTERYCLLFTRRNVSLAPQAPSRRVSSQTAANERDRVRRARYHPCLSTRRWSVRELRATKIRVSRSVDERRKYEENAIASYCYDSRLSNCMID